jgi:hypothetical protein
MEVGEGKEQRQRGVHQSVTSEKIYRPSVEIIGQLETDIQGK